MTWSTRILVLVLGLAAAAGAATGLVLLPLAAWAALEGAVTLAGRVRRPRGSASGEVRAHAHPQLVR
jgi:hypothetical protein